MQYKHRLIEKYILEVFQYYPVIAVLGARQVGKSTLIENLFKDRIKTIVFDPVIDILNAREDPDFFLQNNPCPLFLDEIQYAPELLNSIKRKVDMEKKNGMFIFSGSQNLSVLKNISESLAGRVSILNLLPMTKKELEGTNNPSFLEYWLSDDPGGDGYKYFEKATSLFPFIWRGGYPKLLEFPDHLVPGYFESYLRTYIERDVRTVSNIGSLQHFGKFIGILAAYTGQEINHTQIGRELGIDRKTALAWTQVAESTFQWFSVPAFSRNAVKRIAGKEKGYFTDTGFACYMQRISTPDVIGQHPMIGNLFETYIVMEIIKAVQSWPVKPNFFHFRSYSGAEVDLILEINSKLYPIEIKVKSNPSRRDIMGIRSLKECFPNENIQKGLVICATESPSYISDDVFAIPWWSI
ncbi:MAG: ATP-binding protein [Desulfobacteraceae bacterium]|nr:ATP-binding protein [Desulfobacteraceae bacterium]